MKETEDDIKKWKGYCANGLKAYVEDNHTTPGASMVVCLGRKD